MKFPQHDFTDQLSKAISGDKQAFGYLYEHLYNQIFNYLLIRTGNRNDAEDMTEIVFLKAWDHLGGFSQQTGSYSFRAWVFRIAHNTLVDHYRKRKVVQSFDEVDISGSIKENPEWVVAAKESTMELIKAINTLDTQSQHVIVSRFFSKLSHKETAQSLGISEGNVRVIQFRTLERLRKILRDKYD